MKRLMQVPQTALGKAIWVALLLLWLNLPASGITLTLPKFGLGLNIVGIILLFASSIGLISYLIMVLRTNRWQGFTPITGKMLVIAAAGYAVMLVVNKLYLTLTPTHTTANNATIMLIMNQGRLPLMMMVAYGVILAPIQEELLFRGLLLGLIKQPSLAVIVSSVLFSCMHESSSWPSFVVYVIMGSILALVRLRAKSLTASWLLHLVNNAPLLLMWAFH